MSRRALVAYILLLALAALALFARLDDRLLWGDEAETALLAVSVARHGVPRVSDDRNRIANLPGSDDANEAGIWIWSPWLDEYIAAPSIAWLGRSAFAARLPFAALGLASIAFLALLARRAFENEETALAATFLYATSVPFLLHARQCRYYAPLLLGQIWLLYGFARGLRTPDRRASAHVAGALAVLFYCNYISVPASLAGLAAAAWILRRRHPRLPAALAWGGAGFGLLALPWIVYSGATGQLEWLGLRHALPNLVYYLAETHFHLLPWVVLAIAPAAAALRAAGRIPAERDTGVGRDLAVALACIAGASYVVLAVSPLRFFRYLVPLIPVLSLLGAWILVRELRPAWLRRGAVAALGLSNAVAMASGFWLGGAHALELPLARFAASLSRPYEDRLEDVVAFLRREAGPDDRVLAPDPEFPLIYHTGLRVIDARLHGVSPDPPADWILRRSPSAIAERPPLPLTRELLRGYEAIDLRVRDSRRGGSRPDPHAHEFFSAPDHETFRIHRIRASGAAQGNQDVSSP